MARVLVVDDEPDIWAVLAARLEMRGHSAIGAHTAEEGLRLAETEPFDLILLDINLPGMSGLSAIREFRRRSKARVVVFTGHGDAELKKDALLLGAAAILPKPLDLADLMAVIEPVDGGTKP